MDQESDDTQMSKVYTIAKNCHYSDFFPRLFHLKYTGTIEKKVTFDNSCRYTVDEPSCVNKLFGFCFGLFGVHRNSVRFGWTYDVETDKIIVWRYVYVNRTLNKEKIFTCCIDEEHLFTISYIKYSKYDVIFKIDGRYFGNFSFEPSNFFGLTLGPYFGGRSRAPHKIRICTR